MVVDCLPCSIIAEASEPAVHRRGGRKAIRQHLPCATGAQHIEDRLDDAPHRPASLASTWTGRWKEGRQYGPFRIGQVASIAQPGAAMLRAGGRGPHEASASSKASNTCLESRLAPPSNPASPPFRSDSEMASKLQTEIFRSP